RIRWSRTCAPNTRSTTPRRCSTARSTASSRRGSAGGCAATRTDGGRAGCGGAAAPASGPEPPRRPSLHWLSVIRLVNVSKSYKTSTRPALDKVNVEVGKGEFAFLIGPSGSGKSTFLKLLLKDESPSKGDVYVGDVRVNKLPGRKVPQLRQTIGCVFQDFRLLQQKSVHDTVAFALGVTGKRESNIHKVVPEVLEMVGLAGKARRLPHELSGGEQQRVAIARAFVNRPLLLLADEPTGNLDPDTSGGIMLLLDKINRTGTTVLMATHDHEIVDSMRRRVVELHLGKVIRDEARGVYGVGR